MLYFAHAGIALGVCSAAAGLAQRGGKGNWFAALSRYADVRILMIGALLPDIIDKPIGQYLLRDTFSNGRIFSHTLLFCVLLAISGWILLRAKSQYWLLTLAVGDFIHLLLDQVWRAPKAVLWPFMGFKFARIDLEGYVGGLWRALTSNPMVYIPEIIGVSIIVWYLVVVLKRKQAGVLLKTGRIS